MYSGTGSGNIDASAEHLRTALERSVSPSTPPCGTTTPAPARITPALRAGMVATASEVTAEVPWDVYTDEVRTALLSRGDAAIVTLSRRRRGC